MSESLLRLFVALWPNGELREGLERLQREIADSCGGRRVPPSNLHITLKFLGNVPDSRLEEVLAACRAVQFSAFQMSLDRVGFWPRSNIVWVGAMQPPAPLAGMVANLETRFEERGFEPETRRFHAHCTLFRKALRRPRLNFEPVLWPVGAFHLVGSELTRQGAHYRLIERFGASDGELDPRRP